MNVQAGDIGEIRFVVFYRYWQSYACSIAIKIGRDHRKIDQQLIAVERVIE
ncbi:hypothetical protein DA89_1800 [Vibrio paracholerae]|nr:hypothetical protein DA89_1800 [Vibrio paracholerae]